MLVWSEPTQALTGHTGSPRRPCVQRVMHTEEEGGQTEICQFYKLIQTSSCGVAVLLMEMGDEGVSSLGSTTANLYINII